MARARSRHGGVDYWPGFVDALSTLLLGIVFLATQWAFAVVAAAMQAPAVRGGLAALALAVAGVVAVVGLRLPIRPAPLIGAEQSVVASRPSRIQKL